MKVLEPGKVAPASDIIIGSGELWLPAKELYDVMLDVVRETDPSPQLIQDVDRVLTRHAGDFSSIFAIKPPSPVDRDELQKCSTEGRYLKGYSGKKVLAYAIVNEAIMLSDMFQINEFLALDLLTTAENEVENYPNWPRGLIAVHMFYEGRFWLIQSLATMIRCSPGRQYQSAFHPKILLSFRRILNSVFREDMMDRLVTLMETFSMEKQIEILESNLALGDTRHRRKVKTLLGSIKDSLAHTIFCYAAQRSLRWAELSRILDYLKTQIIPEERQVTKGDATLIASTLYAIETTLSPSEIDMNFGHSLNKFLRDTRDTGFKCMELWDLIKLAFLIAAHRLRGGQDTTLPSRVKSPMLGGDSFLPGELRDSPNDSVDGEHQMLTLLGSDSGEFKFSRNCFGFLQVEIFSKPLYYTWDQDICKVFHGFLVDFITFMPQKVKEMKYRSEEAAKKFLMCQEQGISPPIPEVPEYESFLECLGEFYEHDPFELATFFFREDSQFLQLAKLVRSCCMESPAMFVSSIRFLTGLTTGNPSAMFDMLRQNGHNASLEHFFESILKYLQNFNVASGLELESGRSLTASMQMNPLEIRSICAYLRLIETICERHEPARTFFTSQKSSWIRTVLQVIKIRNIPREIRASMLDTLAAMIGEEILSPEVVTNLWDSFYSTRLIDPGTGDVKEELEEKETRLEEYSLTVGMLRLLKALVKSRFRHMEFVSLEGYFVHPTYDNGAIFPYVNYVIDAIFLKTPYRLFKDPNQRWYLMRLSADILSILLDYLPKLMIQLLCDSPLIRTLLNALVDCVVAGDLNQEAEDPLREEVDQCSLSLLNLLWRGFQRQKFYMIQRREIMESQDTVLLLGIHKIIMTTAVDGGAPEYILSLIRYVDNFSYSPHHIKAALEILSLTLEDNTENDFQIYHALVWQEGIATVFKHMLTELLHQSAVGEDGDMIDSVKISALKLLRTSVIHSDPNVGLFLLNFDVKKRGYGDKNGLLYALVENATPIPNSFMTILTLLVDPRVTQPTLSFLRSTNFFQDYLREPGPIQEMSFEGLSYFLKCLAIELKSEEGLTTATELASVYFGRLEEILNMIQLENLSVDLPDLEFFDTGLVMQALSQCEYIDKELRTRLIRVEMLDGMLKDEITKLEKSTVLHLRKTVHSEAKEILNFARNLNQVRMKEGCKLLVFDGWRQVVEVLALTPQIRNTEFCPTILRMLLVKVLRTKKGTDFFLRLAAESTLTLSAVMAELPQETGMTTSAITVTIHSLCQWLGQATNVKVRGILYAALLYCVNTLGSTANSQDTTQACQNSFPLIIDNLCRDCCQGAGENTRMQALYLVGEIIKCTTSRGLGAAGSGGMRMLDTSQGHEGEDSFGGFGTETLEGSRLGGGETMNRSVESIGSLDSSFMGGGGALSSTRVRGGGQQSFSLAQPSMYSSVSSIYQSRRSRVAPGTRSLLEGGRDHSPLRGSASEAIMNCVYTNGFLSTTIESLCVMDDLDLMSLLTGEQDSANVNAMRAFFVFEAKLSMLSRLASSGLRAVLHLMDLNLIKRLTDMKVFELQSYQLDDSPSHGLSTTKSSDLHQVFSPSHSSICESLYIQVLKLFHVMIDSAPKNVQVLEEILRFLRTHDLTVSKLLGQGRIGNKEHPRAASKLLTSLMAKLAGNPQRMRAGLVVFSTKSSLKQGLLNILRNQADRNLAKGDPVWVSLVKETILLLYYLSKPLEDEITASPGPGPKKSKKGAGPVLTPSLDVDILLTDPDENVSLGVILQVVIKSCSSIGDSKVKEKNRSYILSSLLQTPSAGGSMPSDPDKVFDDHVVIIEVGLSLIFFHIEAFLQDLLHKQIQQKQKGMLRQFMEQVNTHVEGTLTKFVTEACKKIPETEYIETLLLKIRRLTTSKTDSKKNELHL